MKSLRENDLDYYEDDTLKDRYMAFYINNILYGIELKFVTEIVSIQKITDVPNTKKYLLGIINLRGSIIPVVSARRRFGIKDVEFTDKTCIMVVNYNEHNVGIVVDEVSEVINITENFIEEPPLTNKGFMSMFISGIGKIDNKVVTIININNLLFENE